MAVAVCLQGMIGDGDHEGPSARPVRARPRVRVGAATGTGDRRSGATLSRTDAVIVGWRTPAAP